MILLSQEQLGSGKFNGQSETACKNTHESLSAKKSILLKA